MKLRDVAHIHSGIYSNTIDNGEVFYIQARDFDANRQIAKNLLPTLSYQKNLEKHFLEPGNVLIVAKGSNFLSAVYDGFYRSAVASTVFLVIHLTRKSLVKPEYLSWYLNQNSTQTQLTIMSRGTAIPAVNKKMLMELEIPIPSIDIQNKIVKLAELLEHEKIIKQKITDLKEQQINQRITKAINN